MKEIVSLVALVCFSIIMNAQSFGISAHGLAFMEKNSDVTIGNSNSGRTLGHMSPFSPGFRFEGNYILPGFSIPVSGYNAIAFTYFLPHSDSAYTEANLLNNFYSTVPIFGTIKTNRYLLGLRFAYEIPQSFNDFLMLHIGWGMGYRHTSSTFVLPEKSATFNYDQSDFDPATFVPVKSGGFAIEILFGGIYELEKFSITAQYSVLFGINSDSNQRLAQEKFRHGLTVGIYLPLKRL
ncbi:hypothetical protein BH09BAC5_BH09BAC5_16420 [soil metagenome]